MKQARLDTVVRIRRLQERIARGEVEQRRSVAAQHRGRVDIAKAAVADRVGHAPTSAPAFAGHRAMLEVGSRRIDVALGDLRLAQRDVDAAVDDWTVANQRLEGIERLDDRFRGEARSAEAVRVQNELDDTVITRWGRST